MNISSVMVWSEIESECFFVTPNVLKYFYVFFECDPLCFAVTKCPRERVCLVLFGAASTGIDIEYIDDSLSMFCKFSALDCELRERTIISIFLIYFC